MTAREWFVSNWSAQEANAVVPFDVCDDAGPVPAGTQLQMPAWSVRVLRQPRDV